MEPLCIEFAAYERQSVLFRDRVNVDDYESLAEICRFSRFEIFLIFRYNRVNALASIVAAQRGWLGASFSCAEVLSAIYGDENLFNVERGDVVALGKGHAAVMQYACLVGRGILPAAELLRYELPDGPQAHTDRQTPGIMTNTGSLGQTLSKCLGLALARPAARIYVVLGDGELQEGQVWEALMSWNKLGVPNLVAIVDRNGIQTDSNVADIMPNPVLDAALAAFGINVITVAAGNSIGPVHEALVVAQAARRPSVLIVDTHKGAGVSFMSARSVPPRSYEWHGKVPSTAEYRAALRELARDMKADVVRAAAEAYCNELDKVPVAAAALAAVAQRSTGAAFGQTIVRFGKENSAIRVLDADLEKSCALTAFATQFPEQFLELGVAEQNMVSIAGGLALCGLVPICNTYANFYRRAAEQIYVNASEKTRVLYAGHYAGLCYATDGKTHQATGDVALFRAIPGMRVVYPSWPEEVDEVLAWFLRNPTAAPLYIRLHRTPSLFHATDRPAEFRYGQGVWVRDRPSSRVLVTAGPHMVGSCVAASDILPTDEQPSVIALSSHTDLDPTFLRNLCDRHGDIVVVEELVFAGGLFDALLHSLQALGLARAIGHIAVNDFPFSTRERTGLYKHFALEPASIVRRLSELWGLPQ
jgi:transketolase